MQALPVFTFANQAGLDMLETTLVALQDITLEKIFDDHGRKTLCSEFPQIMQQVLPLFSMWDFYFYFGKSKILPDLCLGKKNELLIISSLESWVLFLVLSLCFH